jgi:hypothetical protein
MVTAVAPFLITSDDATAKRYEIADFTLPKVPYVRVLKDLRGEGDSEDYAWLEAAVPVSRDGMPMDESVVVAPVNTIASAMALIRSSFRDSTAAAPTSRVLPNARDL